MKDRRKQLILSVLVGYTIIFATAFLFSYAIVAL